MSDSFEKLKKRFLINAIIISAVCAVSAGVISAFAVLLALKLSAIDINAGFYVLIGFGCAAIVGGILFLILRPTDKRVAKKLDNEYSLNERVQTMVEFAGSEGELIALQRADASDRLSKLPKKSYLSGLLKLIAIPVLAVAMLFTGIFVPGFAAPDKKDPPISITEMQKKKLAKLIEDVKSSDLEPSVSVAVVVVLDELLESVDDFKVESDMKTSVIAAVTVIDELFSAENSFVKIYTELNKYEKTSKVASSVLKGVTSYNSINKIKTLLKVNSLSASCDSIITDRLTAGLKEERDILCGSGETAGLRDTNLKTELTSFLTPLNEALAATGYAETDDALYGALNTLSAQLSEYGDRAVGGGYAPAIIWQYIDGAVNEYANSGTAALSVQMYNCMMDEFVRENLADIFGLKSSDLPAQTTVLPEDQDNNNGGDDDKQGEHDGGVGPSDSKYGSNDKIYDPESETHIVYGDVFTRYQNEMEERINRGDISDELIKILVEYFNNLAIAKDKNKE